MVSLRVIKRRLSTSWRFFAALAIPLIFLPLIYIDTEDIEDDTGSRPGTRYKAAYVILVMALYWGLEVIPLPVTSLLPLVMFPLLGVMDSYTVSESYTKESNMIFLGGVIVALGVEYSNLHHRFAVRILILIGTSPARLLFGVMASTAFLAMWISATTCVALLVPLAVALIDEIYESPELNPGPSVAGITVNSSDSTEPSHSIRRRHSSSSTNLSHSNKQRRMSSMFENSALDRVHRRGSLSDTAGRSVTSPQPSIYPPLESYHSDQHLNVINEERPKPKQLSIVMQEIASEPRIPTTHKKGVVNSDRDQELENISVASSIIDVETLETGDHLHGYETTEAAVKEEERRSNIKKMYLFAMAYSANIGGTAVITGTAPNKVFKEVIKLVENQGKINMTFFPWMALNVPPMFLNIFITWVYLIFKYHEIPNWRTWYIITFFFKTDELDKQKKQKLDVWKSRVKSYLVKEYDALGPMGFHETAVAVIFVGVVILWVLRAPELFPGWSDLLQGSRSGDSTAAMLGVLLLFICPRDWAFLFGSDENAKYEALLDWKFVASKLPWGVLLLLGSGFAISDASDYSGLSKFLGDELLLLKNLSPNVLLLVVIVMTSLATEVTSNVACANILLPIMVSVSTSLEIHPLFLTVATAVTCSYAFLLPVAAPSNAIVFAAGNFSTIEMVKNGFFLNVICVAVLYLSTITYGEWLFDFSDYKYNSTTIDSDDSPEDFSF